MSFPAFIGLTTEFKLLSDLWAKIKGELLLLYGRRRVGKTRLLTHWHNKNRASERTSGHRTLYWVARTKCLLPLLRHWISYALFRKRSTILLTLLHTPLRTSRMPLGNKRMLTSRTYSVSLKNCILLF